MISLLTLAQATGPGAEAATPGGAGGAEAAVLLSIFKPLVFYGVLLVWGWIVSHLDKDADYFFLQRRLWNIAHIASGVLAFGLWLLLPWFWIGLVVSLLLLSGSISAYVYYRNNEVPPGARWTLSLDSFTDRFHDYQQTAAQARSSVRFIGPDGEQLAVPAGDDPKVGAHQALEEVLTFAIPRHASMVELMVSSQKTRMAVEIDGVAYPQPELGSREGATLIKYLKQAAEMDTQDVRRRQTGQVKVEVNEGSSPEPKTHTLALRAWGSTKGLSMQLEIDPQQRALMRLDDLGLTKKQQESLEQVLDDPERGGVVVVASPAAQGLSTTMYSLVERHDPYTQHVVGIERETDVELEGVSVEPIGEDDTAETLAKRIQTLIRRESEIIMIDPLIDGLAPALADSEPEVRFYVGVRSDDTFNALRTWVRSVGDLQKAADSLTAVVAVRLVRKLCTQCRKPYTPDKQLLRKLNLPEEKVGKFYKHSGQVMVRDKPQTCPECVGLGYRGRIGIYEVMALDDEARKLIAAGQIEPLRSHLRKHRMVYMQEAALTKVAEGRTSISEVTRALTPPGQQQAQSQAKAQPAAPAAGA